MPRGVLSACHLGGLPCHWKKKLVHTQIFFLLVFTTYIMPRFVWPWCILLLPFIQRGGGREGEINLFSHLLSAHAFPIRKCKGVLFALRNWYPTMTPKKKKPSKVAKLDFSRDLVYSVPRSLSSHSVCLNLRIPNNSNLHLCMHLRFRAGIIKTVASVSPSMAFSSRLPDFLAFTGLLSDEKKPACWFSASNLK